MPVTDLRSVYTRPDWVRRINAMGEAAGGPERFVPIDADALIADACADTGLQDFGDFDTRGASTWERRFRALVDSVEADARLHTVGRLMTRGEFQRSLRARLWMSDARRRAPAIADERVAAPIVISGPARSGTSILFELLALDPGLRGPLATEAFYPVPPVELAADDLLRWTESEQEIWATVQPEMATIHELRSDIPVECITLQIPSFAGFHWPMVVRVLGMELDFQAALDYHGAALQTLQYGAPERTWVLKTPVHLMALDQLFATYPDAWLVHTHRDPLKTMPSGFNTAATVRWLRSDEVDPQETGGPYGTLALLEGVIDRRAAGDLPDRIVDSHFSDLMADPVAAIEALYDRMGRALAGAHADAIRDYVANRPKDKFGAHKYAPEDWGIEKDECRARSQRYVEHYGVALEG